MCLTTNFAGTSSGTANEGPVYANCSQLLTFAANFWSPPAVNSCDHSPILPVATIQSFTPSSGAPGSTVTFTGSNFTINGTQASVTINGVSASVLSATSTQLTITLPFMAPYTGQFTITNLYGSALSGSNFSVAGFDSAYWTESNSDLINPDLKKLKTVSKASGTITTLKSNSSSPISTSTRIVVDANNIYWSEFSSSGSIKKLNKLNGTVTTLASALNFPYGIAIDASNVYWAENNNPNLGFFGAKISKVAISGGVKTLLASHPANLIGCLNCPARAYSVAVDAANVYWTEIDQGGVWKVGINGGTLTTLSTVAYPGAPAGIMVDSTSVYWIEDAAIKKTPTGGGTVTTIATTTGVPVDIAIDSTSIYWTEGTTIKKVGLNGGVVTVLASSVEASSIAVDAANVYWIDGMYLNKVAKTGGYVQLIAFPVYGTGGGLAVD